MSSTGVVQLLRNTNRRRCFVTVEQHTNAGIVTKRKKLLPTFYIEWKIDQFSDITNGWWGTCPTYPFENADFWPIFALRASAVIPSKNSLVITNRELGKPSKEGLKMQNGRFSSKRALFLKKICYKVSFVKTVRVKVVRHSLAYLSVQNGWCWTSTFIWNFGRSWPIPFKNAEFQLIKYFSRC